MEQPSYFLEKAAQCRRLAAALAREGDPVAKTLLKQAKEFDAKIAAGVAPEEAGSARGERPSD
jgi:hypothetical protein